MPVRILGSTQQQYCGVGPTAMCCDEEVLPVVAELRAVADHEVRGVCETGGPAERGHGAGEAHAWHVERMLGRVLQRQLATD